jgi:hypothetical protein
MGRSLRGCANPNNRGDRRYVPIPDRWLHVIGKLLPVEIGAAYIPNAERSRTEKRAYWDRLRATGHWFLDRSFVICGDLNTRASLHRREREDDLVCGRHV